MIATHIAGTTTEDLTGDAMPPAIGAVGTTPTTTHTMKILAATTDAAAPAIATTEPATSAAAPTHTSTTAAATASLMTATIAEAATTIILVTLALSAVLPPLQLRPKLFASKSTRRTGRWRTC